MLSNSVHVINWLTTSAINPGDLHLCAMSGLINQSVSHRHATMFSKGSVNLLTVNHAFIFKAIRIKVAETPFSILVMTLLFSVVFEL